MKRNPTELNVLSIFLFLICVIIQTNCLIVWATKLMTKPNSYFSYSNQNAVYCNYKLNQIVKINKEKSMSTLTWSLAWNDVLLRRMLVHPSMRLSCYTHERSCIQPFVACSIQVKLLYLLTWKSQCFSVLGPFSFSFARIIKKSFPFERLL